MRYFNEGLLYSAKPVFILWAGKIWYISYTYTLQKTLVLWKLYLFRPVQRAYFNSQIIKWIFFFFLKNIRKTSLGTSLILLYCGVYVSGTWDQTWWLSVLSIRSQNGRLGFPFRCRKRKSEDLCKAEAITVVGGSQNVLHAHMRDWYH